MSQQSPHDAAEAAIVGLAHRVWTTHLGVDAAPRSASRCRDWQGWCAGRWRRTHPLPGLSITGSPGCGYQFAHDIVPGLAAIRMRPIDRRHRCLRRRAAASTLARGASAISGRCPLARVDHQGKTRACGAGSTPCTGDAARELREVVAERGAETAGLEKVALHVDDDERSAIRIDRHGPGSASTLIIGRLAYLFLQIAKQEPDQRAVSWRRGAG